MAIDLDKNKNNSSGNSYSQQDVNRSEQMTFQARSLTEELKDQLGIRSRLNETEKAQLTLARQLQASAAENTVEIGNQGNINRQLTKDRKLLLKIETERLSLEKTLIGDQKKYSLEVEKNSARVLDLQEQILNSYGDQKETLMGQLAVAEEILKENSQLAGVEGQRYALALSMESTAKTLIGQRQKEAEIQKDINDKMGVSGALVKGTGALMERLGMRSGIFNDAMTDSAKVMQEMAEESTRLVDIQDENGNITKGTLKNYSKMEIMLKGFSTLSEGFGKALFDPFTIGMGILKAFLDVNKAGVEFGRVTGQNTSLLANTVTEGSNLVDLLTTATEFTKQTGLNAAAIFSPDQLGQISDAKNLLGISAEQAGKLGMIMKLTGKSADQLGESIYENVDAGISQKVVYDDILSATDDIRASVGGNTKALAGAASAARKLGLDLTKVNTIADGLMDFESSIGAELEAQLLTGKNINLSKARELALNNDLEGVAKELEKNGASAAEYAKMNRIQQQALAKALGVSREELGKMVLTKEAMAKMSDDEIAAARGVTLEQSKQMDIQEKIGKLTSNFLQSFSPLLEAFMPVVDILISGLRGAMFFLEPLIEGFRLIGDLVDYLVEGVKKGEAPAIALSTALAISATYLLRSAIAGIWKSLTSIPAGLGIPLAITATAGLISLVSKSKADDMVSPGAGSGYGSRTLTGPEGAIALNNKDTVIAGTDLFGGGEQTSTSSTIQGEGKTSLGVDMRKVEAKLDQLISVISAGGDVFLDGNKVGSALVLGSYKSS
jgi:hypothetical protein